MESGELEKTTGYKINWRMFGGGGDVIKAMASGGVQIGEAGSRSLSSAAFWSLVRLTGSTGAAAGAGAALTVGLAVAEGEVVACAQV